MSDTIAAIATARGIAALAILRVSGPGSIPIVSRLFRGKNLEDAPSHSAHVGFILDEGGAAIDHVVVTLFRGPNSVTGEDVVEISCHGGDFASQLILRRLLESGARLAGPGEFTQRAFLNGKIDLTQAEAVADLIHASSSLAHRVSVQHIQGRYSDQLQQLRSELIELSAYIELELDFSEEDVEFADKERLITLLDKISGLLAELVDTYPIGEMIRDGVRVVIAGRPNAGKSTLLNAILGRNRAIVSDTPGTTRDEIEAEAEIGGIRFRFLDTAGIREATDVIEVEGVRRAQRSAKSADILIYVVDAPLGLDSEETSWLNDMMTSRPHIPIILVANKSDRLDDKTFSTTLNLAPVILSAEAGIENASHLTPLISRLQSFVTTQLHQVEASPVVVNQRHQSHLRKALEAVSKAKQAITIDASGDMLAIDLRAALYELGQITGEITNEDVLDQIFSRFCIGK